MHLILIPLLIIALLVGFYYAGDVWKSVKSSIPFLGDKELQLPGSEGKSAPAPSPDRDSPYDTLK